VRSADVSVYVRRELAVAVVEENELIVPRVSDHCAIPAAVAVRRINW
jgi:hypothetical protein